jgi:hypothetical protein
VQAVLSSSPMPALVTGGGRAEAGLSLLPANFAMRGRTVLMVESPVSCLRFRMVGYILTIAEPPGWALIWINSAIERQRMWSIEL